ncbi:DUF6476 family protein [Sagittula stellata]|uniref:Uncharacterized protein n=1 Tax=Sagittula stellata (strain ATCC 700073 / DSM 11524 / E-37) TaxID=388399 RepID=A3K0C5_SAGS3|nr:DUF6476 family protein [Sagittula stellata]EBA09240.1 hypothetical protein SSE37_23399 [Sagittula stellata E-37]
METPEPEYQHPPGLRFLQAMVTVLMVVMMVGIVGILGLIWHRYSKAQAPLPEVITLPDGATATAYTQGVDWYAVVTGDNRILIFDRGTGKLRQEIAVEPAE